MVGEKSYLSGHRGRGISQEEALVESIVSGREPPLPPIFVSIHSKGLTEGRFRKYSF